MKQVIMRNVNGKTIKVSVGYSFTTFFFSFIPDLLRGAFLNSFLLFVSMLVLNVLTGFLGVFIPWIYAIKRNKFLIEYYMEKGYKIIKIDNASKEELDTFMGYEVNM